MGLLGCSVPDNNPLVVKSARALYVGTSGTFGLPVTLSSRRCDPHARYFDLAVFESCAVGEWAHATIRMFHER